MGTFEKNYVRKADIEAVAHTRKLQNELASLQVERETVALKACLSHSRHFSVAVWARRELKRPIALLIT